MLLVLTVISGLYFLALVVLVVEMATAPIGYQDQEGFHSGDEPAANFDPYAVEVVKENTSSLSETVIAEPKPSALFA